MQGMHRHLVTFRLQRFGLLEYAGVIQELIPYDYCDAH
jgi:hypothetical protein